MKNTTCGPMYLEALESYTGGDENLIRTFAAGFIHGQAEKVYLGAARAAMFRPSGKFSGMVAEIARDAARRYSLSVTGLDDEIWICRSIEEARMVHSLRETEKNTPQWHYVRASLCGIPYGEIDEEFHLRKGYDQPCDVVRGS